MCLVQENLDTPRLPPNRWNPDARACWEAGGGVVAGEQSSGGRISFSSWSPACRIQLPGRKWEELNRKYMLKSHSRHSRKLRLRWNTETHTAGGGGVTATRGGVWGGCTSTRGPGPRAQSPGSKASPTPLSLMEQGSPRYFGS